MFEADGRDIKVRSIASSNYQTGTTKADFIHVTLRILSGRSDENKATFVKHCDDAIRVFVSG
ncbi:hypothetical protein O9929_27170 [Vibrio lentus]|nr:hypothetical protein [Vibrio lentus]